MSMQAERRNLVSWRPALAALLLVSGVATAQAPAQDYDLSWWTVDGGGTTFLEGDGYALGGTAGQPDAGTLSGGTFTLGGGFWGGGAAKHIVYLPLVLRSR